jgi:Flp pilus assembly protein TadG
VSAMHGFRRRDQRGQAAIEMIGIIPLAALIAGAIIQLYLVGHAAVSAEAASRIAARAASTGAADAEALGEAEAGALFNPDVDVAYGNVSAPGNEPSVGYQYVDDSVSAEATLTVPFLGIGVQGLDYRVTRYTVMPRTN